MARSPFCDYLLDELLTLDVIVGLHWNLTHGWFEHRHRRLLRHSGGGGFAGRWLLNQEHGPEILRSEFTSQMRRLASLGVEPRYLDSHHHVHLVPGVLRAIAPLLEHYGLKQVRLPLDPRLLGSRRFPVFLLALAAKRTARSLSLSHLPCLYPLPGDYLCKSRLRWLLNRRTDTEVITHPAAFDDLHATRFPDSLRFQRVVEYRALMDLGASDGGHLLNGPEAA